MDPVAVPPRSGGVLCAGNLVFDIPVRAVSRLQWDTTTWVDSIGQSLGGNGANTAYALATLGVRVRLIGLVGPDSVAETVLGWLRGAGVDVGLVGRSSAPTAMTVALVDPGGARALFHRPGASAESFAEPLEFPDHVVAGCSRFHLANPFALPNLRRHAAETLRRARDAGLSTSLDAGWDARGEWLQVLGPCLPHLDYLMVNLDEARMLTAARRPETAAARLRDRGAATVVVKLGPGGCLVCSEAGTIRAPAFDVEAVDTTGAGDCHAGAFLAALERGATLEQAAGLANAAGALSVQQLGAVAGLRSWEQTQAWMAQARRKQG